MRAPVVPVNRLCDGCSGQVGDDELAGLGEHREHHGDPERPLVGAQESEQADECLPIARFLLHPRNLATAPPAAADAEADTSPDLVYVPSFTHHVELHWETRR